MTLLSNHKATLVTSSSGRSTTANECGLARYMSTGIEDQRLAGELLAPPVRVAVTNDIPLAVVNGLLQKPPVVAVQEGDPHALHVQVTKPLVASLAALFDRLPQRASIIVDVAEHEMGRPRGEHPHNLRRADIAAVDDQRRLQALQQPNRAAGVFHLTVRIANNADAFHGPCLVPSPFGRGLG